MPMVTPPPGGEGTPTSADPLAGDRLLRGCTRVEWEGVLRPLLGRVILLSQIGKGGMGAVYLGVHRMLGHKRAVKVLLTSIDAADESARDRFLREARIAAGIDSPHLVRVHDAGEDGACGLMYLEMEYVSGVSAWKWLEDSKGVVSEHDALTVCLAATRGLEAAHTAHEPVIHRDVKPGNILIPADRSGRLDLSCAKLADLGLARHEDGERSLTGSNVFVGTPGYAAPEQILDAKRAGRPADVFSIGATLYALLSGRAPFAATSTAQTIVLTTKGDFPPLASVRPRLTPATLALVDRCLATSPSERFPDATALRAAMRRTLDECAASLRTAPHDAPTEVPPRSFAAPAEGPQSSEPEASAGVPAPRRGPTAANVSQQGGQSASVRHDGEPQPWAPTPSVLGAIGVATPTDAGGAGTALSFRKWVAAAVAFAAVGTGVVAWGTRGPAARLPPPPTQPAAAPPTAPPPAAVSPVPAPPRAPQARFSVDSQPTGAQVRCDGADIGKAPLHHWTLAPGRHEVVLSLAGHDDRVERFDVASGQDLDLGAVALVPWGTLDFGALEPGTTLLAGGEPFDPARPRQAGPVELTVRRPGHVDQKVFPTVKSGARTSVRLDPWKPLPGTLDVSSLEPGVQVWVGNDKLTAGSAVPAGPLNISLRLRGFRDQTQTVQVPPSGCVTVIAGQWEPLPVVLDLSALGPDDHVWEGDREIRADTALEVGDHVLLLRREGHADQTVTLEVRPGEPAAVQPGRWTPLHGRIGLSSLEPGVRAYLDGEEIQPATNLAPGIYRVLLRKKGCVDQTRSVTVEPGRTSDVRAGPWTRHDRFRILRDLVAWDGASTSERRTTAEAVDGELRGDGWGLKALETYSSGGRAHEVAIFEHHRSGLEFALVPGGTFRMGSEPSEPGREADESQHEVVLVQPFLLARTEFPQSAWERLFGENRSQYLGADRPVETVSWEQATAACRSLGLSLPSEAQWEFACRAGSTSAYSCGAAPADLRGSANLADAYLASHRIEVPHDTSKWRYTMNIDDGFAATAPRARFAPNGFGLYDMHGNVWEWCADGYAPYPTSRVLDPPGDPASPTRVCRGGSWRNPADLVRSACRFAVRPSDRSDSIGFRAARSLALD